MHRAAARGLVVLATMGLGAVLAQCSGSEEPAGPPAPAKDAGPPDTGPPDAGGAGAGGSGGVQLAPGEVATEKADGEEGIELTLATPSGAERFIAVLFAANVKNDHGYAYTATVAAGPAEGAGGGVASRSAPAPSGAAADVRAGAAYSRGCVRRMERALGAIAKLPPGRGMVPMDGDTPPVEGEKRDLEIADGNGVVHVISAEAVRVTDRLVVYLDRTTPGSGDIAPADLDAITAGFGEIVLPRERIFFGQESDVNGDGHVSVLFSPLTYEVAVAYFNPWDLITDPEIQPAGEVTNNQEILYLTPPAVIPKPYNTPAAIIETMAHEFQHAIYFYRKYMMNDQLWKAENVYITEGLSALAQDLSGYQAGNFYVTKHALDNVNDFSAAAAFGGSSGYDPKNDGALRGGAYLFLRYLYDQAGGDKLDADGKVVDTEHGAAWLQGFVGSPEVGWKNIEASTGRTRDELLADWYAAMMIDDRGPEGADLSPDPVFNYLPVAKCPLTDRVRGTSMFLPFHGQQMNGPAVADIADADGTVLGGGADYLSFAAAEAGETVLTVSAEAAADLVVRVVRVE
ncbi:MAG: hypothetical protein HY744_19860 [Deltaproteobacteria bacterium]|nr:hypothetical protein [Deltaproteobacteria bacterium]